MSERPAIEAPVVLAHRGVPVVVYQTTQVAKEGQPTLYYDRVTVPGKDDEFEVERKFVSMPAIVIARLEDLYGTVEQWQETLAAKQFSTVVATLAEVWRETPEQVSARLLDGNIAQYSIALQVACYRAQGVAVDDLGKLLKRGLEEAKVEQRLQEAAIMALLEEPMATEEEIQAAVRKVVSGPLPMQSANASSSNGGEPKSKPEQPEEPPVSIPGPTGSAHGSRKVAPSKSSGRPRPRKSASSSRRT